MNGNTSDRRQPIAALPYKYYFAPTLIFTVLAICNSVYLAITHYRNYTDLSYRSFCAISRSINCDTVAQSPWALFLNLPVAYWGILGFVIFLVVLLKLRKRSPDTVSLWAFLVFLSAIFSVASIYFSFISFSKISAYCILCLLNHCLSFALFTICFIAYRRFGLNTYISDLLKSYRFLIFRKKIVTELSIVLLLFVFVWTFIPEYWNFENLTAESTVDIQKGVTNEGNPWIGKEDAEITIHIYSDYMCFQCYKVHHMLRSMISGSSKKIKLIFHHYPLDNSYNPIVVNNPHHIGSGKMAQLAVYAMTRGKFWEMNDTLFELGRQKHSFSTEIIAKKTGFSSGELAWALQQDNFKKIVEIDIRRGMKYRITSTPSFVIDGNVYTGMIPEDILN